MSSRVLVTRRGPVPLPAYLPVTTFGDDFPLDALIRPYLPRLAPGAMVSYQYARKMKDDPGMILFVDSGGFASLLSDAVILNSRGLGIIEIRRDHEVETICPRDVLDLQERIAEVGFTLDFPIPPSMGPTEAKHRHRLTIANALWAYDNRRRKDLLLFACVQGWDVPSFRACARAYAGVGFDGFAVGGLVPRAQSRSTVTRIIEAVRSEIGDLPLHVFGLGKPDLVNLVLAAGADSVDSSSYVKMAADGRLWSQPEYRILDPSPTDRLHLALCNLASASGCTLPLSTSRLVFSTFALTVPVSQR
jgi:tRNA-guanine family transglycosylase